MVIGSVLVGINLLLIGWTREVGSWFIDPDEDHYQTLVIWIAVVAMYLLDFSINAVQAACRAIIVDTLPAHKQEIGNAWASRMVAGGHLVGYTMYTPLPPKFRLFAFCSMCGTNML
jgi:solute carrier family 45, member 1/2/4